MIQEAKLEHDNLGTDESENYKFIVVGHGLRKRVIKQRKLWEFSLSTTHDIPQQPDLILVYH